MKQILLLGIEPNPTPFGVVLTGTLQQIPSLILSQQINFCIGAISASLYKTSDDNLIQAKANRMYRSPA